jgi:hypothetical protein
MLNDRLQTVSADQHHCSKIFKNERLHLCAANFGFAAEAFGKNQPVLAVSPFRSLFASGHLGRSSAHAVGLGWWGQGQYARGIELKSNGIGRQRLTIGRHQACK